MNSEDIFNKQGKFIIFKHSPRCAVSLEAKEEVKKYEGDLEIIEINVLEEQELKMEIADRYKVQHESPQIMIIEDQKCIDSFSHYDIKAERLNEY